MKRVRILIPLLAVVLLTGCIFYPHKRLMSPEIEGKVVNAETMKPMLVVQVQRMLPEFSDKDEIYNLKKGGTVLTDKNGLFHFDAVWENRSIFMLAPGTVLMPGEIIISSPGYKTETIQCQTMSREYELRKLDIGTVKMLK